MFFERKSRKAKSKTKILYADFDRESSAALTEKTSLFATVKNGRLCSADSFESTGKENCYGAAKFDFGMVYCEGSGLSAYKNGENITAAVALTSPTFLYNSANDTVLVSSYGVNKTYALTTEWTKVFDRGFGSMALFRNRAFGARDNRLYFTESDDWTKQGGYIDFPCEIYGVATAGNKLYVVGKNIYRVDFDENLKNTVITPIYSDLEKVFGKTVAAVGDKVFFATAKGLFCWDGETESVNLHRETNWSGLGSSPIGTTCRGNYFLLFRTTDGESVLTEIDGRTAKAVCYYPVTSNYLCGGKTLFFNNDDCLCSLSDSGCGELQWKSEFCDFGSPYAKHFRKIHIVAQKPITVKLVTEEETRIFFVEGSENIRTINLRGSFRRVSVEFCASDETEISEFGLEVAL